MSDDGRCTSFYSHDDRSRCALPARRGDHRLAGKGYTGQYAYGMHDSFNGRRWGVTMKQDRDKLS